MDLKKIHPLIKIKEDNKEELIPITGYLGSSKTKVRLYHDLNVRTYYDIGEEDILYREASNGCGCDGKNAAISPITLYVKASATIISSIEFIAKNFNVDNSGVNPELPNIISSQALFTARTINACREKYCELYRSAITDNAKKKIILANFKKCISMLGLSKRAVNAILLDFEIDCSYFESYDGGDSIPNEDNTPHF